MRKAQFPGDPLANCGGDCWDCQKFMEGPGAPGILRGERWRDQRASEAQRVARRAARG